MHGLHATFDMHLDTAFRYKKVSRYKVSRYKFSSKYLESKHLDTKYLDTKYLDAKYLDTKYLDTKYLNTKYLDAAIRYIKVPKYKVSWYCIQMQRKYIYTAFRQKKVSRYCPALVIINRKIKRVALR